MHTVGSTHISADGQYDLWGLSPSLHFNILSFLNSVVSARMDAKTQSENWLSKTELK